MRSFGTGARRVLLGREEVVGAGELVLRIDRPACETDPMIGVDEIRERVRVMYLCAADDGDGDWFGDAYCDCGGESESGEVSVGVSAD